VQVGSEWAFFEKQNSDYFHRQTIKDQRNMNNEGMDTYSDVGGRKTPLIFFLFTMPLNLNE